MAGYGSDIWFGENGLVPGKLARGVRAVAQWQHRCLTTRRGTLRGGQEELAWGYDLSDLIGAVGYPAALAAIPGIVRSQLSKDERVSSVDVQATMAEASDGTIAITLVTASTLTESGQTFQQVFSATELEVTRVGGVTLL